MKLTNKQKAALRDVAPTCADRLADRLWDILDLDEIIDSILPSNRPTLDQEELSDLYSLAEIYLTKQIGKNL